MWIIYCTLKNENIKNFQKLLYVEIHKNMTKILVKFYYMTQNITSDFKKKSLYVQIIEINLDIETDFLHQLVQMI